MAINTTNIHGFNINGNDTSPDQFGHYMRKLFNGSVSGADVSQSSTPNMTVVVSEGIAILTKNTVSSVWLEIKQDTSVTIATADTANPRYDAIVLYEDTNVALPTAEPYLTDGAGGRFKLASITATAQTPAVKVTDNQIVNAIGAGKAWTRLADVYVASNTSTIIDSNITDTRTLIAPGNAIQPEDTALYNYQTDFGGVIESTQNGGLKLQAGWGQMSGASSSKSKSETVNFPQPFTTVLGVVATPLGFTASDGTPVSNLSDVYGSYTASTASVSATDITNTEFTATFTQGSDNNMNPNRHYAYSWIAWGIV